MQSSQNLQIHTHTEREKDRGRGDVVQFPDPETLLPVDNWGVYNTHYTVLSSLAIVNEAIHWL